MLDDKRYWVTVDRGGVPYVVDYSDHEPDENPTWGFETVDRASIMPRDDAFYADAQVKAAAAGRVRKLAVIVSYPEKRLERLIEAHFLESLRECKETNS